MKEPLSEKDLNYPDDLPVTAHRAEILAALRANPVVIVCGDTGSGKTTQLPKMALELGRAAKGRRIACTQPRRLAAVTMAERVATELSSDVGRLVGFRHRFGRKVSSETRIEFMTDGVLLAETRFDPLLRAYDTIIVDEAHERSLNVDFLLGILKRILHRRNDLKVVISSATLDTERFSAFFGNAPALVVPGRLFPIDLSYQPPPDDEEASLPREIATAVGEIPAHDDILVFLPGERDIREAAEYLVSVRGEADDVIPLLASLPAAEQRRAFLPSRRRRIILATNVAETSVTIPGIRAVIDSGLARISRYIHRTQVQRLQIEPVSKASARQRMGRCGRLGPGKCIRLYSEGDFAARDDFTPPEILRSSLAGVILTMLDLRLGDIERFPFIDPPKPAMIHEGLRELLELGAIRRADGGGPELTPIGRKLAKIPVEPRLSRMLVAASDGGVLGAVLPLVAAMACDDPRRRPLDERQLADQAHARFRVAGSDFLGTLKLWSWWQDETATISQSKARKLCKANYLSYPKMREWRDLKNQLETLAKRLGLSFAEANSGRKKDDEEFNGALHRALLTGLLGRIGRFDSEESDYRGAHAIRFAIHPGSVLAKKDRTKPPPQWIVAGELVDTERLFARNAAVIDPRWLEPIAGAICKHSYHSPGWDGSSGFVRAIEQVTLYGLVIVSGRRCDYSRVDLRESRKLFIRFGLVGGEFPRPSPPIRENLAFLDSLRRLAERSRHPEFFDEAKLEAFFDRAIPGDVASADALRRWVRVASKEELARFRLEKGDWWPSDAVTDKGFPDAIRIAGVRIALSYRHSPDDAEHDGVMATVPKSDAEVLRLWRADWLVPGLLGEKIAYLISLLPSALRRVLSPINETVAILLSELKMEDQTLEEAICAAVRARWGFRIPENAWRQKKLPPHLLMRFRIRDNETGRTLACGRNLDEVLAAVGIGGTSRGISAIRANDEKYVDWVFGDMPRERTDANGPWQSRCYPALHDEGDGVAVRIYPDAQSAELNHEKGVTRLLVLALAKTTLVQFHRKSIPFDAAFYLKDIDYADERISADVFEGAIAETLVRNRPSVRSLAEFESRLAQDRSQIVRAESEIAAILVESSAMATKINAMLNDERLHEATVESVTTQLAWLLYRGFPRQVPLACMRRYARYMKGALVRVQRACLNPRGDLEKEGRFAPYWQRYREALKAGDKTKIDQTALREYRWMLEEYRVSIFAQELHTPEPISPKRLDAKWNSVISFG